MRKTYLSTVHSDEVGVLSVDVLHHIVPDIRGRCYVSCINACPDVVLLLISEVLAWNEGALTGATPFLLRHLSV